MAPPTPILACLFDMDGLLLDSEDLYTLCTNILLAEYNRLSLPWSIKAQLQGRPGPSASKIFHDWAQLPCTPEEYQEKNSALQREHFPSTKPLPGVEELLRRLGEAQEKGKVEIALATSSHRANFELKTNHLQALFSPFRPENRVLGDDPRIPKGRGKPAPDIYLLALETLNARRRLQGEKHDILPQECLVFEDSVPGVESGRRAGMQVVWCPHPELLKEYQGREEEVLAGLTGEHKEAEAQGALGTATQGGEVQEGKKPGVVGDGWAVLLGSLEEFPYGRFGIEA
jgi:pseudouridine-5'-monophosphatase